jgi:hypothetical protein
LKISLKLGEVFSKVCTAYTKLIKVLVPPQTRYNHQKGCSTVTKVMQERFSDDFAVGIIDRDKKELGYANQFDGLSTKHFTTIQTSK